jgi:hypothetical protein
MLEGLPPSRLLSSQDRSRSCRRRLTVGRQQLNGERFCGRTSNPEWGDDFQGFVKRLGNRQVQFIIQNSVSSLGNGIARYDRCRCDGFWPRTRHAMVRNFVTHDRTEKSLRPQLMPYLGAFGAASIASTWAPGHARWEVQGYQAAITQVSVGMGINWIYEFAPEIGKVLKRKK